MVERQTKPTPKATAEPAAKPSTPAGSRRSGVRVWRRLWLTGDDRHADCHGWRPPTNFYETSAGGTVQIEVAGLEPGDYRVAFADGLLTVAGNRGTRCSTDTVACHRMEIASGRFMTRVAVPWPVRVDAISVDYGDGFLVVNLPRLGGAAASTSKAEG